MFEQLRYEYACKGYALAKKAIPPELLSRLKDAVIRVTTEHAATFQKLPRTIDVFQQTTKEADPLYMKLREKFRRMKEKRRRCRLAQQAKALKKEGISLDPSGEDIWAMSQRIATQVLECEPKRLLRPDPQMIAAVSKSRVNAWMFSRELEELIRSDFGKLVGSAARAVCDVKDPILFADKPIHREAYGRPLLFHFAAPFIGVSHHESSSPSCTVWAFLDSTSPQTCEVRLIPNCVGEVREVFLSHPSQFDIDFLPMDSHMAHWLERFPTTWKDCPSAQPISCSAGDLLILNPFQLVALGSNHRPTPNSSIQMHVTSVGSSPSLQPHSWVRNWKANAARVNLASEIVFPKLF